MGLSKMTGATAHCEELMRFHGWRRKKVSDLLKSIDQKYFSKQLPGSFSSLFIILKHVVWAEKVWYCRIVTTEVASMPELDVNGLLEEWEKIGEKWQSLILVKEGSILMENVKYFDSLGNEFENSVEEIVVHLVDHTSYHVGQLMSAIRSFEIDPVSTNYIHYLREK